jgi:hypothetical protein
MRDSRFNALDSFSFFEKIFFHNRNIEYFLQKSALVGIIYPTKALKIVTKKRIKSEFWIEKTFGTYSDVFDLL